MDVLSTHAAAGASTDALDPALNIIIRFHKANSIFIESIKRTVRAID